MKIIAIIVVMFSLSSSYSQTQTKMYRNNIQFNIGYTFYDGLEKYKQNQKGLNRFTSLIEYDGFLSENLSIGLFGGITYSSRKEDSVFVGDYWGEGEYYKQVERERRYLIGLKASTYFMNTQNLQIYFGAGVALGMRRDFRRYSKELYSFDSKSLTFMYDAHFGANYYFNEHLGITGKLGYKLALCRVGISCRY